MQRYMLFPPQRHLTFAKFDSRPGSVHARSASAQFAMRSGIAYQEPILVLAGRLGAGKTHLLHATANLAKSNTGIHSVITISSRRLAEEVQRATAFDDLHIWGERFASEGFLGIDDVDDIFGHGDAASFLLEVLRLRANANLRTVVSASLSSAPDIPCPLITFLNHQRAVRLL
jgi:chromosomal replication initiation ATPase DnaA